ncbi:four-carbon acid sugar kinase family protein [Pararhizobium haloflavum]|uniref:four-carbon acid sugar kinase family protein n=1 Tax=Pararhizobium haloflavum TaxID=2037914 RepID=UPI000C182EFF|nr:four-carbon acid sugar kinase family protein [Pararhizobium haloflavum]
MSKQALSLAYYGDDFTGSTDVMEALSGNGVPTVLFTRIPTREERARFSGFAAVGLAGSSRSRTPQWMSAELPVAFRWLAAEPATIVHYKVCSTFDSAPERGSIGRALEIGLDVFGQDMAAIVVGAPQLRRYTFYGHLFAAYGESVYRIDRHPVMSRHPATPMGEADLLRHLAGQTDHPVALLPADACDWSKRIAHAAEGGARGLLVDVHDATSQHRAGAVLRAMADAGRRFVIGSSGVEYALLAGASPQKFEPLAPQERIAVVSGSCSPTTERQIRAACAAGFEGIAVDHAALGAEGPEGPSFRAALARADAALRDGKSPLVYTALGAATGRAGEDGGAATGRALGALLARLVDGHGLSRIAVAGGDTSSHAVAELGVLALTLRKPVPQSPGSPVSLAHFGNERPPLELLLKGGQIGGDSYFADLRDGRL